MFRKYLVLEWDLILFQHVLSRLKACMDSSPKCIPADPDISGIGVRTAIYAQNTLCFVPVIINLWDRRVTRLEVQSVESQSTGILTVAF
jgi:hypothetical protein